MNRLLTLLLIVTLAFMGCQEDQPAQVERSNQNSAVQFSVWYWLNSATREQWGEDFEKISQLGFTHVILCWGFDLSAFRLRTEDSAKALELCNKNGLKAYLLIWHPVHNTLLLEAPEKYLQVDNQGQRRFSFNLYNREWRNSQWRSYLHKIGVLYRDFRALAGYVFDDSFSVGPVSKFGGQPGVKGGDFVSYSDYDREAFRSWLEDRYQSVEQLNKSWGVDKYRDWSEIEPPTRIENETIWRDWTEARTEWLTEWAKDTMNFIRDADPDPQHVVYIEDIARVLGLQKQSSPYSSRQITVTDINGLLFGQATQPFDRVGAYMVFTWEVGGDPLRKALESTRQVIEETKKQAGGSERLVYTFWISDRRKVYQEGPIEHPSAEEIWTITKAAVAEGVRHIDYYGYRIGDWRVADEEEWKRRVPGTGENYPLTKQFHQKWLVDRPDSVAESLGRYVRSYLQ